MTDNTGKKNFAPTEIGEIAKQCWDEIPKHYPFVTLDEFIVMPNHIHGIININSSVGANDHLPLQRDHLPLQRDHLPLRHGTSKTIGAIIRGYKIGVTKWCRNNIGIQQIWQRNYYEHIIRNDISLQKIREYIINNPQNWEKDELYT